MEIQLPQPNDFYLFGVLELLPPDERRRGIAASFMPSSRSTDDWRFKIV